MNSNNQKLISLWMKQTLFVSSKKNEVSKATFSEHFSSPKNKSWTFQLDIPGGISSPLQYVWEIGGRNRVERDHTTTWKTSGFTLYKWVWYYLVQWKSWCNPMGNIPLQHRDGAYSLNCGVANKLSSMIKLSLLQDGELTISKRGQRVDAGFSPRRLSPNMSSWLFASLLDSCKVLLAWHLIFGWVFFSRRASSKLTFSWRRDWDSP